MQIRNLLRMDLWLRDIPVMVLFAALVAMTAAALMLLPNLQASAACSEPSAPYGTLTLDNDTSSSTTTVVIPADGDYRFWVRMQAADTTNNAFLMNIDGNQCQIKVGDNGSMPANQWVWINYKNGNPASTLTFNLSAGAHQVKFFGTEPSVKVDRVLFLSNLSCVPEDKGDNCASGGGGGTPKAIYRLVKPANGKHGYTADDAIRDSIKSEGYTDDGRPFTISTTPQTGMIPIYSMYNGRFDDRWLTIDGMNRYWGINFGGYRDDGIAFYAYPANNSGTPCTTGKPVYQLWHGGLFDHFYTTQAGDRVWGIIFGGYIDDNSGNYRNPAIGNVGFCAL